ncbi:hypothetical protein GCM10010277_41910 [Streptomyces longisporoflavus]|uniref:hypothetical protein n=1 Tax=Streptomyces longisporoflavus TaxID=28044 RepID=UPI00167E83F3|nr:hypothetical protein [Streptomyces longisporoflavus]GGV48494.1 hypothetical protein GCM10010277_41910 [Streptomyces longisporoflavus]
MSDSMPGPGPEPVEPDPVEQAAAEEQAETYDPAGPAPLGVERAQTGDARVDGLLERLGDADHLATDGHIEVYEDVHRGLRDALTALDAHPGPPVPSPMRAPAVPSPHPTPYNRS